MPFEPFIDLWSILIFLGAAQAAQLAVNCFTLSHSDQLATKLLGWLILSVGFTLVEVLLCYSNYIVYAPFLVGTSEPFNFVFPPLLYFYTLKLTNPAFRWKAKYNWVFLPALLLAVYMIPFFAQSNAWLLQTVVVAYHKPHPIHALFRDYAWANTYTRFYQFFKYLLVSYQLGYLFLTLNLIYRYKSTSSVPAPPLRWVEQISWSFLAVFITYALLTSYYQSDVGDVYVATCVSLVYFGMSFRLISQSKLLAFPPALSSSVRLSRPKYEKNALDELTARQTLNRLILFMEQEKPYRQVDLTLPALATQLAMAPHHLSQVINQYGGQNFFDFINSHRIREIKGKLSDPQYRHIKLEAVAFESGFQSKSAFNAAFKKITQQTPSQYRKAASLMTV